MSKLKVLFILLFLPLTISTFAQSDYYKAIEKDRLQFEQKLLQTDSVLNAEEREAIQSLNHFPIDSSWVITAQFTKDKGRSFNMPTTTSRTPRYKRIGYLHFAHNTEKFKLAVYKNLGLKGSEYKNYVFVPFVDKNAPNLTYGGGRYLDLEMSIKDKVVIVDFNKAYNPYCVYSYRYSCPITPKENHVDVKINAGIMNPDKNIP
ncbi:DUF1684 domain-containing protein [Brumimicrobium oceani]|uniref:DUF1684 domain-containing protein n=1 Tax=Brumimicrobium oceani TaxID=2100725 RepID=A0A2U2XGV1_9FLAO|nr:DUF1684 domain-containing protein [Brumimicrobium oceani]PWH86941.1 hypothetical protein DIT68_01395 [Brumimicrobium oceani]